MNQLQSQVALVFVAAWSASAERDRPSSWQRMFKGKASVVSPNMPVLGPPSEQVSERDSPVHLSVQEQDIHFKYIQPPTAAAPLSSLVAKGKEKAGGRQPAENEYLGTCTCAKKRRNNCCPSYSDAAEAAVENWKGMRLDVDVKKARGTCVEFNKKSTGDPLGSCCYLRVSYSITTESAESYKQENLGLKECEDRIKAEQQIVGQDPAEVEQWVPSAAFDVEFGGLEDGPEDVDPGGNNDAFGGFGSA